MRSLWRQMLIMCPILLIGGHNGFCNLIFLLFHANFAKFVDWDNPTANGRARLRHIFHKIGLEENLRNVVVFQVSKGLFVYRIDIKIIQIVEKVFVDDHFFDCLPVGIFAQQNHQSLHDLLHHRRWAVKRLYLPNLLHCDLLQLLPRLLQLRESLRENLIKHFIFLVSFILGPLCNSTDYLFLQ